MVGHSTRLVFVLTVVWPLVALSGTPPTYDASKLKDKFVVLSDGHKHQIVLVPFGKTGQKEVFYGNGKRFYRQSVFSSGSTAGVSFSYSFWDPRTNETDQVGFSKKDGYWVKCGKRKTPLKPLPKAQATAIIALAKFYDRLWQRRAFALARNDSGQYFFVDRYASRESHDFQLYRGPRGNMKRLHMKNVIYDSAGAIFSTKKGTLRLVLSEKNAYWIDGDKRTPLIKLPLYPNRKLIYDELGVYFGKPLGTPCDDL
jgi:hypothetical protein